MLKSILNLVILSTEIMKYAKQFLQPVVTRWWQNELPYPLGVLALGKISIKNIGFRENGLDIMGLRGKN